MKKKFLTGFIGIALATSALAAPVNKQDAQKAAQHFMEMQTGSESVSLRLLDDTFEDNASNTNNSPALYVFATTAQPGFVIISGDDAVKPVLGYSLKNEFAGGQPVSPEVTYWLNGYAGQIREAQAQQLKPTTAIQDEWENLLNKPHAAEAEAQKTTVVTPFLTTTWNQLPYYNDLCPATPSSPQNSTLHAPAGCVATAMSQIMKYWETPKPNGTGSHSYSSSTIGGTLSANFGNTTYEWDNMPNVLNRNSSTIEKNAIATLMFHCGVAVEMDYDVAASGALVINRGFSRWPCAQNAFTSYFGYSSGIKGYQRSQFSNQAIWIEMLKFELDNGRPILYAGFGSLGGHAFVFDGYNQNDYFHVNWGWGGMSDGYFTVDNLSPSALGQGGGGGNFNSRQEVLVMIEPDGSALPANPYSPNSQSIIKFDLTYTELPQASIDKIYEGDAYAITCKIKNEGTGDFDQSNYKLCLLATNTSTQQQVLIDQKLQTLRVGDEYQYSYSSSSFNKLVPGSYDMAFAYIDSKGDGKFLSDNVGNYIAERLTVLPKEATGIHTTEQARDFTVYPNPADGMLTITQNSGDALKAVELFDATGRKIYEQQQPSSGSSMTISTAAWASGMYYLKLTTDEGTQVQKVSIKH